MELKIAKRGNGFEKAYLERMNSALIMKPPAFRLLRASKKMIERRAIVVLQLCIIMFGLEIIRRNGL